jgi:hypothetical protein
MSEIIGAGGLIATILQLFNLNATNNKTYFERMIEPAYTSLKELHNNYINTLVEYADNVNKSNYTIREINNLIDLMKKDMILTAENRIKIAAICQHIRKKNKVYGQFLSALHNYIALFSDHDILHIGYEIPKSIYRFYDDIIASIDLNQKIILTRKQLEVIREKEVRAYSNVIRIILIEELEEEISQINAKDSNNFNKLKKRFSDRVTYIITNLNFHLSKFEECYWILKNEIYK